MPFEERRSDSPHVVVIASLASSLVNFRIELLRSMVSAGCRVTALAPEADTAVQDRLRRIGVKFETYPLARTGLNPFEDAASLWALVRLLKRLQPDVVLPYTMKPVIYGGIAARLAGVRRRHALMTGLGFVYSDAATSPRRRMVRRLCDRLYRSALAGADCVFVYNDADAHDIAGSRMLGAGTRMIPVPGSGVDLDLHAHVPPRPTHGRPLVFTMIARLLRDKGVMEFVEAARRVRRDAPDARFRLVGPLDPNPTGITAAELEAWSDVVEYAGPTDDVRPFLRQADVFVLPSYYREGIPRTILEAMATGRAIVTTDLPGCRDTVEHGKNGFQVRPRDVPALADALLRFTAEPGLVSVMGARSRVLATRRFDVHRVNRQLLDEMGLTAVSTILMREAVPA